MSAYLEIIGAKENNLKDISIKIPKQRLVVITGVSGCGKSSLAFDTIRAEGQRRYLDTLSNYAKQFAGSFKRPQVEKITGLSPIVSIEQKTINKSPRSTVGTITEIYDFLRLLFAKIGQPYSYATHKKMVKFSEEEILSLIKNKYINEKISLLAPLVKSRKGHYKELFKEYKNKGFREVRVDGKFYELRSSIQLDRYSNHDIDLVIDNIKVDNDTNRLAKSLALSLKLGKGSVIIRKMSNDEFKIYSKNIVCADTGLSYDTPSPNTFSFNSPYGYCNDCKGLGYHLALNIDAVIPNKSLSFSKGAIAPLKLFNHQDIAMKMKALLKANAIDLKLPLKKYPQHILKKILLGNVNNNNLSVSKKEREASAYEEILEYVHLKKKNTDFKGLEYYLRNALNSGSNQIVYWAKTFFKNDVCKKCKGARINIVGRHFKINNQNIYELSKLSLKELQDFFEALPNFLTTKEKIIAKDILNEISMRLKFLNDIGLYYLNLNRMSSTLSGGEAQRIRLATQISSKLQGITFILDEPSIGLHAKDNEALINALKQLRDIGNSIFVVEHDKEIMLEADHLIDIGPDAGIKGGDIIFSGKPKDILNSDGTTADYLAGKKVIEIEASRRKDIEKKIFICGASGNNLKDVNVEIPLGKLVVVTGVSGSGKSSLIVDTLYPILASNCNLLSKPPLPFTEAKNLELINKVVNIDQSPIGRTSRSNPATYCGFFTDIRNLFGSLPESKVRGYKIGMFSFNVKGGRCEECKGGGYKNVEMGFLPDIEILCPSCGGKRYHRETLDITYNGKNIYQVLDMNVSEAVKFFQKIPYIHRKIKTLEDVRLGYLKLGQSSLTLSGGEAQRVKLASELNKKDTGKTFYILDEPTTGLHFQDINYLLNVLNTLVNKGNTVLVIEHNMDIIYSADHIIDLGYGGGKEGGNIIFQGTPEELAKQPNNFTGKYLSKEITFRNRFKNLN